MEHSALAETTHGGELFEGASCSSGNWTPIDPGFIEPTGCFTIRDCVDILAAIPQIQAQIAAINNNSNYNQSIKETLIRPLSACLRSLIIRKAKKCRFEAPFPDFELRTHTDFEMRAKAVGMAIEFGEYDEALLILDQINPIGEEALDYVAVQTINIRRLVEKDEFVLTSAEENQIYHAGNKPYPLAAYARGLYTLLTGNVIYPQPNYAASATPRGSKLTSNEIAVYPNPFLDQIIIENISENSTLDVYDSMGRNIVSKLAGEFEMTLNTSDWNKGMYILQIRSNITNESHVIQVIK